MPRILAGRSGFRYVLLIAMAISGLVLDALPVPPSPTSRPAPAPYAARPEFPDDDDTPAEADDAALPHPCAIGRLLPPRRFAPARAPRLCRFPDPTEPLSHHTLATPGDPLPHRLRC